MPTLDGTTITLSLLSHQKCPGRECQVAAMGIWEDICALNSDDDEIILCSHSAFALQNAFSSVIWSGFPERTDERGK